MAATLVSIAVTPAHAPVVAGGTVQLTATGTYDDASTADVTTSATWASANTAGATVGASTGLVTGVAGIAGSLEPLHVRITATIGAVVGAGDVMVSRRRDFYAHVDVSAATSFTKTSFGLQAYSQALVNLAAYAVEFSFDGSNVDGTLAASGGFDKLAWGAHPRSSVWLRRQTGTGGAASYVEVFAAEEC